jgi:hypothetical protein
MADLDDLILDLEGKITACQQAVDALRRAQLLILRTCPKCGAWRGDREPEDAEV